MCYATMKKGEDISWEKHINFTAKGELVWRDYSGYK